MNKPNDFPEDIDSLMKDKLFIKIRAYGLIDEIALRNVIIKSEYRKLRKHLSLTDALFDLSEKYYLSEHAINNILFRKRKKKPIIFPNPNHIPFE